MDNFSLSLGNPVYAGAVGKTLRLRVLVSDINGGGACGNYNTAEYLDLFVTFAGSPVGNPLTKWVRQLSDVDADQYIRTRTAPDGSVYALGRSAVPKTYSYSFGYCYALGQLSTTADPGKSSITSASNGHHGYISNLGMLNKYNKNGTLQWSLPLLSYGYDGGNGAALKVTGMAVDRFGYVYVCGTYQGNITFSLSNNLTTNSYQQYYTKGFVAKFHPSDGHQVLGWQMGANPNATSNHYNEYAYLEPTGLDVAPDGRLYVAGHFIGSHRGYGRVRHARRPQYPRQLRHLSGQVLGHRHHVLGGARRVAQATTLPTVPPPTASWAAATCWVATKARPPSTPTRQALRPSAKRLWVALMVLYFQYP